jgi:hypothetical protein
MLVILSDKASALHFVLLHRKCSAEGMLAPQRRQISDKRPQKIQVFLGGMAVRLSTI